MAAEVILAVDSSKLDTSVVATSLEWDQIDLLVTELARTSGSRTTAHSSTWCDLGAFHPY